MAEKVELIVDQAGLRLDKYLAERIDLSRSRIKDLAQAGQVLVNGKKTKVSYKVEAGDQIEVNIFASRTPRPGTRKYSLRYRI